MYVERDLELGVNPEHDPNADAITVPQPAVLRQYPSRLSVPLLPLSGNRTPSPGDDTTTQRRQRRFLRSLWVSKVESPAPDYVHLDNGFIQGSMSDQDFCHWVHSSPPSVRDAVVCDIMWWKSKKAPMHHRFLVLTIAYWDKDDSVNLFYLRIERIGKGVGFRRHAVHRITILQVEPFQYLATNNTLLFALFNAGGMHTRKRSLVRIPYAPAFRDPLDFKWQGPPATLWHICRYIEAIVHLFPRYSLLHTNCYYFSRLLLYVVALRHYSFEAFAARNHGDLGPLSAVHDPSAISSAFTFLRSEESRNSIPNRAGLYWTVLLLLMLAWLPFFIYFIFAIAKLRPIPSWLYAFFWPWMILALILAVPFIHNTEPLYSWRRFRSQTIRLVDLLDNDSTLTHPRGKRGDYLIPDDFWVRQKIKTAPKAKLFTRRTVQWVAQHGPRLPVEPWEYPEQNYNPDLTATSTDAAMDSDPAVGQEARVELI